MSKNAKTSRSYPIDPRVPSWPIATGLNSIYATKPRDALLFDSFQPHMAQLSTQYALPQSLQIFV